MKIERIEHLHADAGDRNFDFLKVVTDDGLVGWSEYNETFGGLGVSAVIDGLVPLVIGKDPRAWEAIVTLLYAVRRQAAGGVVQQAIAAIENALLDVKARALGVPVYELFGGPVRERVRVLLVALRDLSARALAGHANSKSQDAARRGEPRQGGAREGLDGAQDQSDGSSTSTSPTSTRRASPAAAATSRAERGPPRAHQRPRPARGLPRGRRQGRRHPGGP